MHKDREKHPTLASDLIEEWRAVLIDSTALSMLNGHELLVDDFYSGIEQPGVFLEKEGFKVTPYIHGLGENTAVRKMFVERANEAWDALEKDNGIPAKSHMMRH